MSVLHTLLAWGHVEDHSLSSLKGSFAHHGSGRGVFAFFSNVRAGSPRSGGDASQLSTTITHMSRVIIRHPATVQSPFSILGFTFLKRPDENGGHTGALWLQIRGNKQYLAGTGRWGCESKTLFGERSWPIRRWWFVDPSKTPVFFLQEGRGLTRRGGHPPRVRPHQLPRTLTRPQLSSGCNRRGMGWRTLQPKSVYSKNLEGSLPIRRLSCDWARPLPTACVLRQP